MSLGDVNFIKAASSLGTPANGEDYISGLVLYGTAPSGWDASGIEKIFSLAQAEALGIEVDLVTAPVTGTIQFLGSGNSGDTLIAKVNGVTIGSTTAPSNSTTNCATALSAAINTATATNGGYTATHSGGVVTITAPGLNLLPLTFVTSGTFVGIVGQFHGAGGSDATGTFTVTVTGTASDLITMKVNDGSLHNIGLATVPSSPTTTTTAAAIALAITLATASNGGYTATSSGAVVTIIPPLGSGAAANGWTLSMTATGATAGTFAQFSGGVTPLSYDVFHYHIAEFFRANPTGVLYVGIFDVPVSFDGTEVTTMQTFANGKMRQIGVYYPEETFSTAFITALQLVYNTNYDLHQPLEIYFGGDFVGVALSSLTDLGLLDAENVHVIISQDGDALGAELFAAVGYSITTLGNALGDTSAAKVSENIGWRAKFPNSDGTELEVIAFANGDLYTALASSLLNTLDSYHYMFLVKNIGITGSFYNDTFSAVTATSDYSRAERNRTIDKAIREIRTLLLPSLNAPLYVNADGTLTNPTIAYFKAQAEVPLATMQSNGEIGAPPDGNGGGLPAPGYQVIIDKTQNVISTSKLVMTVKIIPVGLAKFIEVNIGFTLSIS